MNDRAIKLSDISDNDFHLESTNILKGLKEDFKLISGKNIFPTDIFPSILQKLILELESTLNFSPDYTSASILYAVSVSIGNKIQLKVKNSWFEKSNLYMVLVGRTGDVKSHSVSFCLNPLMKIDKENFEKYLEKKKNMKNYQLRKNLKIQFQFFGNCF